MLALPLTDPTAAAEANAPSGAALAGGARLSSMFDQHFAFVWRSVRRLGVPADSADDAAQEVFLVASRRLDAIEPGKEKAFLFGTAVRVAADARRRVARRREVPSDDVESPGCEVAVDELVDRKRARELLDRIVSELPDSLRPVFVLHEIEGMTMADIADCLALAPGTVASRLRRARDTFNARVERLTRGGSGG